MADGTCISFGHEVMDRGMGASWMEGTRPNTLSGHSLGSLHFETIELVLRASQMELCKLFWDWLCHLAGIGVPEGTASSASDPVAGIPPHPHTTPCSYLTCPLPILPIYCVWS